MDNDTTLLLDLDGLAVARVERLEDGARRVHLITADEQARARPECEEPGSGLSVRDHLSR